MRQRWMYFDCLVLWHAIQRQFNKIPSILNPFHIVVGGCFHKVIIYVITPANDNLHVHHELYHIVSDTREQ